MRAFQSLLIICLFLFSPAFAQQKQAIVTSDLLKLQTASQISISPYGSRAVYVVTSMAEDEENDYKYLRHIWMANLDNDNPYTQQLTFGDRSDSQPSWSPDGSRIAFVRKDGDKSQI